MSLTKGVRPPYAANYRNLTKEVIALSYRRPHGHSLEVMRYSWHFSPRRSVGSAQLLPNVSKVFCDTESLFYNLHGKRRAQEQPDNS